MVGTKMHKGDGDGAWRVRPATPLMVFDDAAWSSAVPGHTDTACMPLEHATMPCH